MNNIRFFDLALPVRCLPWSRRFVVVLTAMVCVALTSACSEGPMVDSVDEGSEVASDSGDARASDGAGLDLPTAIDVFGDVAPDAGADAATDLGDPTVVPWPTETCVAYDPSLAEPSDALFPSDCLVDVDVTIAPLDWETLRRQSRTVLDVLGGDCLAAPPSDIFSWFRADATIGGQPVSNLGIRKKGFLGSLSDTKPSLKLRFDKYVDGQRLAGMKRMTLNNVQQDPSLINACLGYAVFARAGIPAPRCAFARVRVNAVDLGVYVHVDSLKSAFIERHFGGADGNLYEGTLSDFRSLFVGTFEKKTNEDNGFADIEAMVQILESAGDEPVDALGTPAFVADLEPWVDFAAFYRFWAAEALIGHWDGYAGNTNNYYIYRHPVGDSTGPSHPTADGRFRFIPWGIDAAFSPPPLAFDGGPPPPESVMATGILAHRLYATDYGRQRYLDALAELMAGPWDEAALVELVDGYLALLKPAIPQDLLAPWEDAVQARRTWVSTRRARILAEQTPTAPDWEEPLRPSICWPKVGDVSATFQAVWGAPGLDPLSSGGSVETTAPTIPGPLGNVSSSARLGTGDDELGEALLEIVAQGPGDSYVLLRVIGPPGQWASNTSYPIDWQTFRGYIGAFVPLQNTFEAFGLLADGVISFSQASTIPGAAVEGTLQADIIEAP